MATKPEKKEKVVKMYNVDPIQRESDNPFNIYGKSAMQNDAGHWFIEVPASSVKNEKKRLSPLMDAAQYKLFLATLEDQEEE